MGPYEVLATIGRGGMGTVYRARHRLSGQIVAVKVLHQEAASNPVLRLRFEQEFAVTSRLAHPNLVRGLDFGEDGGRPYLVMEYVDGPNLAQEVARQGRLPLDRALKVFAQITAAVQFAHRHDLIHRDVKPANILLGGGQARLTDLGLTKDRKAGIDLTLADSGLGTLIYAPPEQFDDARNADARSDVYGLAASLYHAVTGIPPFQGKVQMLTLGQKMRNDFVAPRKLVPSLPAEVDLAIRRALDADPSKRPGSCEEWLAALGLGGSRLADAPRPQAELETSPELALQERRAAPRSPVSLQAVCNPLRDASSRWPAEVADLSLTGVRLRLKRRFEPGALLAVELLDGQACPRMLLIAVVRWTRKLSNEVWSVGCRFHRPLSQPELDALLGVPEQAVPTHAGRD